VRHFLSPSPESFPLSGGHPLAVIIEPMADLAGVVRDVLTDMGYETVIAATHIGAARLSESRCPQLLVACVPAHAQDAVGAYLADCRDVLGMLPTVLMLSDAQADLTGAPVSAARLLKPFTSGELMLAIDLALVLAEHNVAN